MKRLPSFEALTKLLQQIPFVPSKHLFKIVDFFLKMSPSQIESFCASLKNVHSNVRFCSRCFFLTESANLCQFCIDKNRRQTIICVVETWHDLLSIEKTNAYDGVYHVLQGALSPLDGIGVESLRIQELVTRVQNDGIEEVILCTNQTPEGEATAMYIARKLKTMPVIISCLARGLPVGSLLGASDKLTVYKALMYRRPF
jgi:recombination protein RecR